MASRKSIVYRCRGHGVHGTSPDSEDRVRDRHYARTDTGNGNQGALLNNNSSSYKGRR